MKHSSQLWLFVLVFFLFSLSVILHFCIANSELAMMIH